MKTLAEIEEHPLAFVRWAREAIFASCDYDHVKFAAHTREYAEQLKREGWLFSDRTSVRSAKILLPISHNFTPMPAISRFFGIIIKMYFSDHNPPHFHAQYGEQAGLIDIATLQMIEGDLSARTLKMIHEWATTHQAALLRMWNSKDFQQLPGLE